METQQSNPLVFSGSIEEDILKSLPIQALWQPVLNPLPLRSKNGYGRLFLERTKKIKILDTDGCEMVLTLRPGKCGASSDPFRGSIFSTAGPRQLVDVVRGSGSVLV